MNYTIKTVLELVIIVTVMFTLSVVLERVMAGIL